MTASKYLTALVTIVVPAFMGAVLSAPAVAAPAPARIVREISLARSVSRIDVYSPAMDGVVRNRVIRATGEPAPTLYLLTGLGGGVDNISWWDNTDVRKFFAAKHVNVVMPIGGAFSMYTDWRADDPAVGRNRWLTYLTQELPGVLDARLGTSRRNAIAGVSMSAGSAIDLAIQAPHRYQAVAAYSGCPWAADPVGMVLVSAQVMRGGGNPANMWGTPGGTLWREHDAFAKAGALAGKVVYLSAASGVPGGIDRDGLTAPPVEAIAAVCTAAFASRLAELGVPAIHVKHPTGSHTWGLFETDLHNSWPYLARALGA
ncbi:alpha/beta hydrolase [Nocardia sp. NPDC051321]|uniref:alpha/beta hydrolase n=1 Tax=Nocardia sp. NPDC051321 TaxID=3364323 RepID=UPI003798A7C6